MRIQVVTPAPRHSRKGNRVTAVRWARILRKLGHRVEIREELEAGHCDLLVALHARKSHASVERFRKLHPERPLVVALTGTDLYRDLGSSPEAHRSLARADRLIVLQSEGLTALEPAMREKARVIHQSARPSTAPASRSRRTFDVCVIGHLRAVKDPFLAASAARLAPPESRLRVLHAGAALTAEMEARARGEMAANDRYRWLGERPSWEVRRLMRRCHAMVLSSRLEGGANVVSEAVVAGLAVLASRISGSVGMLGEDYPGYFEVGAAEELAALLDRCESRPGFLEELTTRCRALAERFDPAREEAAWSGLIEELA
jgi:putative glycosyltransferase (TIGR04348 family)